MSLDTIKERIGQIDTYKAENKTSKEILKEQMENDPFCIEAVEKARVATLNRNKLKNEILNKEENLKIREDIKDNQYEIQTLNEILSTELVEVYQKLKTDEVEDLNGEKRKFKIVAKLLTKKETEQARDEFGKYAADEAALIEKGFDVSGKEKGVDKNIVDDKLNLR